MKSYCDLPPEGSMRGRRKCIGSREGFWSPRLLKRFVRSACAATEAAFVCILLLIPVFNASAAESSESNDATEKSPADVLLVIGAPGTEDFGELFSNWAATWQSTCEKAGLVCTTIGGNSSDDSQVHLDVLQKQLEQIAQAGLEAPTSKPLWIVLIGHGTWDGKRANFNLAGPDVSATEMNAWVQPISRPMILINCSASSAPFIDRLSGPNRVIVTATKSGSEQNFARFGGFIADAFSRLDSDLDHDDSVSVREAYLKASDSVERYYKELGQLVTEHALLDDNGDAKGSSFKMVLGKQRSKQNAAVDGKRAATWSIPIGDDAVKLNEAQLKKRNELEAKLKQLESQFAGDADQLREAALPVLIELGGLYARPKPEAKADDQIETEPKSDDDDDSLSEV